MRLFVLVGFNWSNAHFSISLCDCFVSLIPFLFLLVSVTLGHAFSGDLTVGLVHVKACICTFFLTDCSSVLSCGWVGGCWDLVSGDWRSNYLAHGWVSEDCNSSNWRWMLVLGRRISNGVWPWQLRLSVAATATWSPSAFSLAFRRRKAKAPLRAIPLPTIGDNWPVTSWLLHFSAKNDDSSKVPLQGPKINALFLIFNKVQTTSITLVHLKRAVLPTHTH